MQALGRRAVGRFRPRARNLPRRPELFEVVVRAHGGLHDMNDDLAGVDQHPFTRLLALDAEDRRAGLLQLVADVVRERLHLPVGFGGGDDERVVKTGELTDVEDGNVAGLDVFEGGYCGLWRKPTNRIYRYKSMY